MAGNRSDGQLHLELLETANENARFREEAIRKLAPNPAIKAQLEALRAKTQRKTKFQRIMSFPRGRR